MAGSQKEVFNKHKKVKDFSFLAFMVSFHNLGISPAVFNFSSRFLTQRFRLFRIRDSVYPKTIIKRFLKFDKHTPRHSQKKLVLPS
ncbi:Hypothetical protein I595_785 [Croceitalea dokdonensis DOKDO 023]|uniref:Uncharacterized protein n=1 Tax=Croceitalea dokdonensis DOKDO 023 TaxID=1300341 RepID=A0A0P7B2C8_9FLAO|nr:Hypothetical protein I595_785 [Croceitalea dokdonensis DOKDO 023]